MVENDVLEELRREVQRIGMTLRALTRTVDDLARQVSELKTRPCIPPSPTYDLNVDDSSDRVREDLSWNRLLAMVHEAGSALTADELARRWGRSRSRTSEVLNKLVDEGRLTKVRDGRRVRFKAT